MTARATSHDLPAKANRMCTAAGHRRDRDPRVHACPSCWTRVLVKALAADAAVKARADRAAAQAGQRNLRILCQAAGLVCRYETCTRDVYFGRRYCVEHLVDDVAVLRAVAGDPPALMRSNERVEAVRLLASQRLTDLQISERVGIAERSVSRIRAVHDIPSLVPLSVFDDASLFHSDRKAS